MKPLFTAVASVLPRFALVRPTAIPSLRLAQCLVSSSQQQHVRAASILANLSDVPEAYNKRIRRGRGPSSGKGKTSGRGHKGQKQHGKVPAGFNGGQTPDEVVAGKRGFTNVFSVEMTTLNLDTLQKWIDDGRIDPTAPITLKELLDSRAVHGIKDGVKLLGRGSDTFTHPITIEVSRASASAIAAIEAAGGIVTTRYFTKDGIRRLTKPHLYMDEDGEVPENKLADASSRWDLEYYRDPAHRGYLSNQLAKGESPSLFFKSLKARKVKGKTVSKASLQKQKAEKAANRLF